MRLIDADSLVANFRKTKVNDVFPNWEDLPVVARTAVIRLTTKYRAIILSASTIDAVPVVRCYECDHAITNEHHPSKPLICCKTKMCGETKPDWFCADGERKDND